MQHLKKKILITFNFGLVLLVYFIGFPTINYSQNEMIRVKTELVTVPVSVIDAQGQYITNLKLENFQLFENGIEQKNLVFKPVDEPLTIFFLIDISITMSDQMPKLSSTIDSFVRQLNSENTLAALTFGSEIDYLFKPTKIKDLQKGTKLGKYALGSEARIYDGVWSALRKIRKFQGRKAIILFSDGVGIGKYHSAKDNYEDALESDAIIYTVQFDTSSDAGSSKIIKKSADKATAQADNYMQKLADLTGGRRYQVADVSDLEKTFAQMTDELGRQYSLGYYPKETGKNKELRQIKVRVNVPNISVQSRDSYIVK